MINTAKYLRAAACALVLSVSFAAVSTAQDAPVRLARLDPSGSIPTVLGKLPAELSSRDVQTYGEIFALQEQGKWRAADRLIGKVSDRFLMGQVLAQRYLHPTAYRSKYKELERWLSRYSDHPQAERIHRLAMQRKPSAAEAPKKPLPGYLGGAGQEIVEEYERPYESPKKRSRDQNRRVTQWLSEIASLVSRDRPTQATRVLNNRSVLAIADDVEEDIARWKIARGYFANRKDAKAFEYSSKAAFRSDHAEPMIHWTAGLAAWRLGHFRDALRHFSAITKAEKVTGEERAAGAFWASRVLLETGQAQYVRRYLEIAADASDEFYGLLAKATLVNDEIPFDWHEVGLKDSMLRLLKRFPGSRRATALAQIGRTDLAAGEIRKLASRARLELSGALAALAESLGLPAAQMRVAQRLRMLDGRSHDGAMYPIPPWKPADGFSVDKAVLFSLMRAETGFDPRAESSAGALGLMQILPSTARAVAKKRDDLELASISALMDPETNIEFGQAYVERLLKNRLVDQNLLYLMIGYNAGLTRLESWRSAYAELTNDQLLFLESIPIPETRAYTKKVFSNLWAYRARLGQETPSLTALAGNTEPTYVALDSTRLNHARAN